MVSARGARRLAPALGTSAVVALLLAGFIIASVAGDRVCVHGSAFGGFCHCDTNWNGTHCDTPVCPEGCVHGKCVAANSCKCSFGYAGAQCDSRGTGVTIVIVAAAVLGGVLCIAAATFALLRGRKGRKKPKKTRSGYMKVNNDGSYSMRPRELRTVSGRKHGKGRGKGSRSKGGGSRRQLRGEAGDRRPASGSNHTTGDLYSPVSSVSPDGTPLHTAGAGAGVGVGAGAGAAGARRAYRARGGSTGYGQGTYMPPDPVQPKAYPTRHAAVNLDVVASQPATRAPSRSSAGSRGSRHSNDRSTPLGSLPRPTPQSDASGSSRGLHTRVVDVDSASPRTAGVLQAHWRRPGHSKLRSVLVHTADAAGGSGFDADVSSSGAGSYSRGYGADSSAGSIAGGGDGGRAAPDSDTDDGSGSASDGEFSSLVASRMVRSAVDFRMPTIPKRVWQQDLGADSFQDHFKVAEVVNDGTTGTVRRCVDKLSGLSYAVKVLDKRLYALLNAKRGSSGGWHTLRQELAILESINHPNLIRLKRLFEDDTAVHVVTDYLAGGTLLDHLTRISRPLAEAEARTVMHQIFKALSYLHKECHIVHRDIKLENVLLSATGDLEHVKVVDLGSAQVLEDGQLATAYLGSVQYMAPEVVAMQADTRRAFGYSFACDMWSAGVLLYALLTCTMPFGASYRASEGDTGGAGSARRVTTSTPPSDELGADRRDDVWARAKPLPADLTLSSDAADLLNALLTVDPASRLSSSRALLHPWFHGM